MVEPPRTQSNLPCRPSSPQHSGSSRFGVVEPLRTHSNLPCRPASPFITVVQGGLVWSNRFELTRTCPVGLLPLHHSSSGRFGVVEPPRTQWNLACRPASPFITVVQLSSCRFDHAEPSQTTELREVRYGRTAPNLLEPAL